MLPVLFAQVEEFGRNLPEVLNNIESESQRILSEPLTFNGKQILVDGKPLVPLERLQEHAAPIDIDANQTDHAGAPVRFMR